MKMTAIIALILLSLSAFAALARQSVINDQLTAAEVVDLIDQATSHQYVKGEVRAFRVVDLDADGKNELVAWEDISGRGHGRLFVLTETAAGLSASSIVAFRIESLEPVLQDVDHDGKIEVISPRVMTPYGGGYPPAEYHAIHVLAGKDLVDKSASFPEYYLSKELPRLEQEIADLVDLQGDGDVALRDAKIAERDKILRLAGRDAAAGSDTAERWASDPLARRRILAASVLRDIGGDHARAILEKLSKDADRGVAQSAHRDR